MPSQVSAAPGVSPQEFQARKIIHCLLTTRPVLTSRILSEHTGVDVRAANLEDG